MEINNSEFMDGLNTHTVIAMSRAECSIRDRLQTVTRIYDQSYFGMIRALCPEKG